MPTPYSFAGRLMPPITRQTLTLSSVPAEQRRSEQEREAAAVAGIQRTRFRARQYPIIACESCGSQDTKSCGHARFNAWIRRKVFCKACGHTTLVELTPDEQARRAR